MPEDDKQEHNQSIRLEAQGDANIEASVLGGDENQLLNRIEAGGHVIQAGKYAHVQIVDGDYYDVKVYTLSADRDDTRTWKQRREALRQATDEPYKFLRYYETSDADLFFGRDEISGRIIEKLFPYKLVLINGKSGSGKTSLINAGLVPRLMDRGYLTFVFRDYGSPPTELLKNAIMKAKELDLDLNNCPDLACVLRRTATEMKRPIAVFFDQFERLFLNLPQKARRQVVHEMKTCFDNFTGEELDIVISVREEFYGQLGEFWDVIPEFHAQSFPIYLKPLSPEEAQTAILGPLGKVSARIDYESDFLEKVLLPALMHKEKEDGAAGEQIEPTHLQIVCNTLYETVKIREKGRIVQGRVAIITHELYDELGGVKGILANYLTDKIKQYGGAEEKAKRMLKEMIIPGREESLRGFVTVEQLHERLAGAISRKEVETLVEKLVDDRLVEKKELEGKAMYSLTHEYMAAMVNQWYDIDELELHRAIELFNRSLTDWKLSRSLIPRKRFKELKKFKTQLKLDRDGRKLFQFSQLKYYAGSFLILLFLAGIAVTVVNQLYHQLYLVPRNLGRLRIETAEGRRFPDAEVTIRRVTKGEERGVVHRVQKLPASVQLSGGLFYVEIAQGKFLAKYPVKFEGYANYATPLVLKIPLKKLLDDITEDMVLVPGGSFLTGDPSWQENVDVRMIHVESFYIDKYEVTNGEYRKFLEYLEKFPSSNEMAYNDEPRYKKAKGGRRPKEWDKAIYQRWSPDENHPVVDVDWYDAYAYCVWRGKRLPTALEWEKAAGWHHDTGKKYKYPWGNSFHETKANVLETWKRQEAHRKATEKGTYESGKSSYGAYDMTGNVLEWTDAWYDPPIEGRKDLLTAFEANEQTMQGGSFGHANVYSQTFWYFHSHMSAHDYHFGFRCAISKK